MQNVKKENYILYVSFFFGSTKILVTKNNASA